MKIQFALFLIFLLLIQRTEAEQMIITGLASIDNKPVSEGTVIVAKIADKEVGICNVSERGGYSITVITDDDIYSPIEFYIDGYRAIQVVPFEVNKLIVIDLNFGKFESTTTTIQSTTIIEKPGIIGHVIGFSTKYGATIVGISILLVLVWYTFCRE